jgi:hypothetical protein
VKLAAADRLPGSHIDKEESLAALAALGMSGAHHAASRSMICRRSAIAEACDFGAGTLNAGIEGLP